MSKKTEQEQAIRMAVTAKYQEEIERKKNAITSQLSVDKFIVYKDPMCGNGVAKPPIVIALDLENNKLAIYKDTIELIDLDKIYDVEVLHKTITVGRHTRKSTRNVNRAWIGGIIGLAVSILAAGNSLGGLLVVLLIGFGAVLGSITALSETVSSLTSQDEFTSVKIYLKDVLNPTYEIMCGDKAFDQEVYATVKAYIQSNSN